MTLGLPPTTTLIGRQARRPKEAPLCAEYPLPTVLPWCSPCAIRSLSCSSRAARSNNAQSYQTFVKRQRRLCAELSFFPYYSQDRAQGPLRRALLSLRSRVAEGSRKRVYPGGCVYRGVQGGSVYPGVQGGRGYSAQSGASLINWPAAINIIVVAAGQESKNGEDSAQRL